MLKFPQRRPTFQLVRSLLPKGLLAAMLLSLGAAAPAAADTAMSSNWSGYAVHRAGVRFTRVLGAWRQPKPSCTPGDPGFSAMWIGLGGFAASSDALEQVGTELDCTASGRVVSDAWYELVPNPSRTIAMTVRPGDLMSARVEVSGRSVTLVLIDTTTHKTFRKTVRPAQVDVSSAEWIVEAPSDCLNANECQILPLANFGSATFGGAQARAASGRVGSISSSGWSATKINLTPNGRSYVVDDGSGSFGAASPSSLRAGGSSFSVAYHRVALAASAAAARVARAVSVAPGQLYHLGR